MNDLLIFRFTREQVESRDFADFLERFSPEALPRGAKLRAMMNRVILLVDGYGDHPDEIFAIPSIRGFYQALLLAWPSWLYFCRLDPETILMSIALCCLRSLSVVNLPGGAQCQVKFDESELARLVCSHFPFMNEMCERAGLSEHAISERSSLIVSYFQGSRHSAI